MQSMSFKSPLSAIQSQFSQYPRTQEDFIKQSALLCKSLSVFDLTAHPLWLLERACGRL